MDEGKPSLQDTARELSECLAQSKQAYDSLLELECEQEKLIQTGDIEAVASLIDSKQDLQKTIHKRDERLLAVHQTWQQYIDQAPPALRDHLQVQLSGLQEVMAEIIRLTQVNELRLKEHAPALNEQLKELTKKRAARHGYREQTAQDAYRKARFYDKSS
jgi:hypothetical protein